MTASTAVHSNAFNFMSFIQNGVDPRTGQYTLAINLPALKSYDLNGPEFPLSLNYNPLNTQDSGYGLGWDLKLSQYTPQTRILSLSTGETFKVTGSGSQPAIKEQKLASFRFFDDGSGKYRIVHKSGLVEHLQVHGDSSYQVALPVHIDSAQGHRLTLVYGTHQRIPMLNSVSDDAGPLLHVQRNGNRVYVEQRRPAEAGQPQWARYTLELSTENAVTRIVLPTEPEASWRLSYERVRDILCLKTVRSPTGSLETLDYLGAGHLFPDGAQDFTAGLSGVSELPARTRASLERFEQGRNKRRGIVATARPALPRVSQHTTAPGAGQPDIVVRYLYGLDGSEDNYNFLGFGAQGVVWSDDGLDNLYQATNKYEYGSTEMLVVGEQRVRSIERRFNRYHLLVEEKTTQNRRSQSVATTYHLDEALSFDLQPPQCQLPSKVETTWADLEQGNARQEAEFSSFDTFGNPTLSVSAAGVREASTWYPADGADGCPPDPWGFVRQLQSLTVTPADAGYADAPVLRTHYRYAQQGPLAGASMPWLAPVSEVQVTVAGTTETEIQRTVSTYVAEPANPATHGRLATSAVTLGGLTSTTSYGYRKIPADGTLETTETLATHDRLSKIVVRIESLVSGNTTLDRDDNNVVIKTDYDTLDRVTAETAAPGTPQEATRYYEYTLVNEPGQQAEQKVTDVKGVQTRTRFDGLNRPVYEERQQADSTTRAEEFLQTYAATYNPLGQLVTETEYDWRLGDAPEMPGLKFTRNQFNWLADEPLVLTNTFEYDDWGQQCAVTGPDGVVDHEVTDPTRQRVTAWRAGMGKTVTTNDLFGNPLTIQRRTPADALYSEQSNEYDGLGRLRKATDAQRNATVSSYDVFDRLTREVLPDNAVVVREYAVHSSEDLPTLISVAARSSAPALLLGTQAFDGLSRMKNSITGNRYRGYNYTGSQAQPSSVETPGGAVIEYSYQPHLSDEPVGREVNGVKAVYELDAKNARMTECSEPTHKLKREYYSTGELKSEQREEGGDEFGMQYCYSLRGRLLSYTDVLGNTQIYRYDSAGRMIGTQLGSTETVLTYDGNGLNDLIDTLDLTIDQRLKVHLEYDDFGRETSRMFDYGAGLTQVLTQGYNVLDQMTTRVLTQAGGALRDESFTYDDRGRLSFYEVQGPEAPYDPAGKQLIFQSFDCDALNNHTSVFTAFVGAAGEDWNEASYSYSDDDPAQLIEITNDHADYAAFNLRLTYDQNGNLTKDEAGRVLEYDALSRLVKVTPDDGSPALDYSYDPVDILSAAANERRFYRAGELANLVEGGEGRTFMRAGEALLAEHQGGLVKPAKAVRAAKAKAAKP